MIQITYRCPKCEATVRQDVSPDGANVSCTQCGYEISTAGAIQGNQVVHCAICSGNDLFIRKDFPQRLGVTIVVLGFALSCVTWFYRMILTTYGVLFATALVDVLLYVFMGDVIECYRCHAHFRGLPVHETHGPFDLEVHERYRQQAARLADAEQATVGTMRSTGTNQSV